MIGSTLLLQNQIVDISLPMFQIGKFNGRSHGDLAFVYHLQQLRDQFRETNISLNLTAAITNLFC